MRRAAPMARMDALRWLAFHALEGDCVTEGDLADALGLDRVALRAEVACGRALDEGRRAAAVARGRASLAGALGPSPEDAAPTWCGHPFVDGVLADLFADGRERTTAEAAAAMKVSPNVAAQRLRRSVVVERVRLGVWTRRGAP